MLRASTLICIWLNSFPAVGRLDQLSPARLVRGDSNIDYAIKRVPFGAYVMTYIGTSNSMETRAVPAIVLDQSNIFGSYHFLSLETGRILNSRKWRRLSITDDVIDTVASIAERQHQPDMIDNYPIFETEPGNSLNFENEDIGIDQNEIIDEGIIDVPMVSDNSTDETADSEDEDSIEPR